MIVGTLLLLFSDAPSIPRPEHPRPDFQRDEWVNLNGQWDFRFDPADVGVKEKWFAAGASFDKKITVPFCWESRLSGIADTTHQKIGWYRRTITPPASWAGKHVWLRFGAVDEDATVWVNGVEVGKHEGGYSTFEFDITPHAPPGNPATIVVRAFDPTDPSHPTGKQVGWYTTTSGIWQTVWIEARPDEFIEDLTVATSSIDVNEADVGVYLCFNKIGTRPQVSLEGLEFEAGTTSGNRKSLGCRVKKPIPWTPETPHLYPLTVRLKGKDGGVDVVKTYFAVRTIGRGKFGDLQHECVLLNGKPIYLRGALDQSFNPEGIYTAPSDEFLQNDLKLAKKMGLNFLRIHIKPDEPRRLYWADKLGVMIMQDMPNTWRHNETARKRWEPNMRDTIARDRNHPSVIAWCLFNETWGLCNRDPAEFKRNPDNQKWVERMFDEAKTLDPTRLVEDHSPCNYDHVKSDLHSWHFYIDSDQDSIEHVERVVNQSFAGSGHNCVPGRVQGTEPLINSEYGAVGAGDGDRDVSWGFRHLTNQLRRHGKIQGYVYTELTDIEWEHNGFANYDRTLKEFGYGAFVPNMTPADLQGADFVGFQGPAGIVVPAGKPIEVKPFVSHFSYGGAPTRIRAAFRGVDELGRPIETKPTESPVNAKRFDVVQQTPILIGSPSQRAYSGAVALELLGEDGKRVAANYVNVLRFPSVSGEKLDANALALRFAAKDFAALYWPNAREQYDKFVGLGKGWVEYQLAIPEALQGKSATLQFMAEVAARAGREKVDWPSRVNRRDFPQTDGKKHPSRLTVSLDGKPVDWKLADEPTTPAGMLPDDPADARGIFSHFRHKDPGAYGYLLRSSPQSTTLGSTITVRLAADAGLSVFDGATGRYPIRPQVIVKLKEPLPAGFDSGLIASPIGKRWRDGVSPLLPAGQRWRYTFERPAANWNQPDFDAGSWPTGVAGFGSPGTPGVDRQTDWTTSDIWMRCGFELPADAKNLEMKLYYDEDCEVFVNGKPLLSRRGYITDYEEFVLTPAQRAIFRNGANVVAVHCRQTTGGQGIDLLQLRTLP